MVAPEIQPPSCDSCGRAMQPAADGEGWRCSSCGARRTLSESPRGQVEGEEFDPQSLIGKVVGGRYRLESVLGQGAMGAVYRGVQLALTKPYAVKVLLPSLARDAQLVARFQQEARIAAAIRHPGLVEVFDFGVEEGIAYYVMELLRGETLSEYVGADRALPPEEAVRIVADAADAVAVAHDKGVIHRDLKPANLFLSRSGAGSDAVKVLDFGVSKATVFASGGPKTTLGTVCGTPAYMSPEQAGRGAVDARSDLYSLGVVLYRLLSGRLPFDAAEAVVVMYMHLEKAPPPLEQRPGFEVPPALNEVLIRALAKRPEDRFPSVREFAAALRASVGLRADPGPAAAAGPIPHSAPDAPVSPAVPEAPAAPAAPAVAPGPEDPEALAVALDSADPALPEAPAAELGGEVASPEVARGSTGKRWIAIAAAALALGGIQAALIAQRLADRRAGWELLSAIPQPSPPHEAEEWIALLAPVPLPAAPEPGPTVGARPADLPPTGSGAASPAPKEPALPPGPRGVRQGPAPAPGAKRRAAVREGPRQQVESRPRETAEIAFTSKVLGRVVASVGTAKVDLFTNRVVLASVPAGVNRVTLSAKDSGVACSVMLETPANTRRALVFGPELGSVGVRGPQGLEKLTCQSP